MSTERSDVQRLVDGATITVKFLTPGGTCLGSASLDAAGSAFATAYAIPGLSDAEVIRVEAAMLARVHRMRESDAAAVLARVREIVAETDALTPDSMCYERHGWPKANAYDAIRAEVAKLDGGTDATG